MLNGIRSRLLLLISLFLISIIIAVTFMIYNFYSRELIDKSELYFHEVTKDLSESINNIFDVMDTISTQLLSSESLQQMFYDASKDTTVNYFENNLEFSKEAHDILWSINSPKMRIENISIFNNSSYTGLRFSPDKKKVSSIYNLDIWKKSGNKTYSTIGPHISYWDYLNNELVFSLYRPFISTSYGFMNFGIIEIEESYQKIEDICSSSKISEDTEIVIFDSENNQVYPYKVEDRYLSIVDELNKLPYEIGKNNILNINNTQMNVSKAKIKWANWDVFILQPSNFFTEPITLFLKKLILVMLTITAIVFVLLLLIIGSVTTPISQLIDDIDSYSLNQKNRKNKYRVKEAKILQDAFLRLIDRVERSTDKLLLANKTELNLRIMNLQAKINPHFLFNSLTAISSVSQEEDGVKVPIMCAQLADLFRYTSSECSDNKTSLKNELQNIELYMSFMKWRYENDFSFELDFQGNSSTLFVPKLILQPLVENSFTHGFKMVLPPYRVSVSSICKENSWIFIYRDNGCGFKDEVLKQLNKEISKIDQIFKSQRNFDQLNSQDKAILNIYIRLKLQFGSNIKISIENRLNNGTEIKISILNIGSEV